MLTLEQLIAVIQMKAAIGPKVCGCDPSRDCPHDAPEPSLASLERQRRTVAWKVQSPDVSPLLEGLAGGTEGEPKEPGEGEP